MVVTIQTGAVNRSPHSVRRTGRGRELRVLTRPPDPREDAQLLAAITDGDRAAFAELYRRHLPWLLVRLGRRCSSPELVDEVVQDTFVAVWRSAGRWDRRGAVAAWIWGIGIRRLVDALRRGPPPGGGPARVARGRAAGGGDALPRGPDGGGGAGPGQPAPR